MGKRTKESLEDWILSHAEMSGEDMIVCFKVSKEERTFRHCGTIPARIWLGQNEEEDDYCEEGCGVTIDDPQIKTPFKTSSKITYFG